MNLTQLEIIRLYRNGNKETRTFLEEKFGKEILDKSNPEDIIFSLEDACEYNDTPLGDAIPFPNPKNEKQECINAFAAKIEIMQAFNKGEIPDWKNSDQPKYMNWYRLDGSSGSVLSLGAVCCDGSFAGVASRLCTLKEKHSKLFFERFPDIEEVG